MHFADSQAIGIDSAPVVLIYPIGKGLHSTRHPHVLVCAFGGLALPWGATVWGRGVQVGRVKLLKCSRVNAWEKLRDRD